MACHTTHVVCVNFIYEWRDVQVKADTERQIFWEPFHVFRVFARRPMRTRTTSNQHIS